jgi:glycolate oxidase iron-sulfur subunit
MCCGAIAIHSGERAMAQEMARRNIDAFTLTQSSPPGEGRIDAIIINAAGCGVAMKEYRDLLSDDPEYAEKAKQFSARVKDAAEFLAAQGIEKPTREIRARVTYQDPCHLAHGQGIRAQPRALLAQIPGLELVEMKDSDRCCGSAGVYNITHPDIAMQVLDEKMENVQATKPEIIVTANAGCLLQLQLGARRSGMKAEVLHVMDLLDRAYE